MAEAQVSTVQAEGNDFLTGPESKIIENTTKRAVKAAYEVGRDIGLTEDQLRALGTGIKNICAKYATEKTRPKINRGGNLNWTKEQMGAMRTLREHVETRLYIDLVRFGTDRRIVDVMKESCSQSFHAVLNKGEELPHEDKTPLQQACSRKARVIDIRPSWYVKRLAQG